MSSYLINDLKFKNNYVIISVNEEQVIVSIDDYVEYKIKIGSSINKKIYDVLKKHENLFKAYNACIRKIMYKDRSSYYIKNFLLNDCSIEASEALGIIDCLTNNKLLDDDKYFQNLTKNLNNKYYSYKEIAYKLKTENLKTDLINEYNIYDQNNEINKATSLANKYLKTLNDKTYYYKISNIKMKLYNKLYSNEIINYVIERLEIDVDNDLKLISKDYLKIKSRYQKKYQGYKLANQIYKALLAKGYQSTDIKQVMEEL